MCGQRGVVVRINSNEAVFTIFLKVCLWLFKKKQNMFPKENLEILKKEHKHQLRSPTRKSCGPWFSLPAVCMSVAMQRAKGVYLRDQKDKKTANKHMIVIKQQ